MQSRVVSELIHKTVVKLVVPSSGSLGSGTIISPDGHILTNMHVVSPHGEAVGPIEVYVMPGVIGSAELSYVAEFVRGDAELDLAVVKIVSDPEGREITEPFLHLKIGDFEAMDLAPPHQVWAWGFPSGSGATITAFQGIVSGYLGEIPDGLFDNVEARAAADGFEPMRYAEILVGGVGGGTAWIKVSTMYTNGISGGALLDSSGVLVGVPTLRVLDLRLARPAIHAAELLSDIQGVVIYRGEEPQDEPRATHEPGGTDSKPTAAVLLDLGTLAGSDQVVSLPTHWQRMGVDVRSIAMRMSTLGSVQNKWLDCGAINGDSWQLHSLREGVLLIQRVIVMASESVTQLEGLIEAGKVGGRYTPGPNADFEAVLGPLATASDERRSVTQAFDELLRTLRVDAATGQRYAELVDECGLGADLANVRAFMDLLAQNQEELTERIRLVRATVEGFE